MFLLLQLGQWILTLDGFVLFFVVVFFSQIKKLEAFENLTWLILTLDVFLLFFSPIKKLQAFENLTWHCTT